MTEKEKLKKAYEDIAWMAIRYAHRSSTYAPQMVRDSIKAFREVFPDWKPRKDINITEGEDTPGGISLPSDSLHDLFDR